PDDVLRLVLIVEHVKRRQPVGSLVDGIFDRTNAVLVLPINTVEGQIDVGLARAIEVGREEHLHLIAVSGVRLGVSQLVVRYRSQKSSIDDDRWHGQRSTALGGAQSVRA